MPPLYEAPQRITKKPPQEVNTEEPKAKFMPLDDARKSSIGAAYDNVAYEKERELPKEFDRSNKSRASARKNSVAPAGPSTSHDTTSQSATSHTNPVFVDDDGMTQSNLEAIANNFTASSTYQPIL